ncbi:N-acetylglucosaminylphosphatidylinositol deacetylase [Exophiala viscosa]|uniref:N-acetylglucosaminylphosphatidylinositol deacetylase n=1 Tax=Exophiala viscosa TaxID=2486360 RepID=A0AAN6ICR8_9EURO|nr:N-acetylglucosaminylphosphatidylinositol deacetylase [Exophiala viscosa]
MSSTFLTLVLAPVLIFALWHITATASPPVPTPLRNKRIILLIAHPDDEAMFFSPTLQALTNPNLQNHLKILCMSTGNADGLGDTRKLELEKAALTLGLRRKEDVFVLDDERFKDGMREDWKPEEIAKVLASAFAPHLNAKSPKDSGVDDKDSSKDRKKSKTKQVKFSPLPTSDSPRASIDVLITFDQSGISGHPNHKALYHGAQLFLQQIMRGYSGYACPVALYTLPSINIFRKYSSILDAIPTMLEGIYATILGNAMSSKGSGKKEGADRVVFINDIFKYWRAREAMVNGHKSQMVWFRWGWIGLGRYMYVNDLRNEKIIAT